ncbi:MAG: adenosine deaminase [Deltaproteobacteria bacterium]|jgi:adenine deaminase|nr:adenosine deaminase [Deltaproteobacteria bacterium]MBT4527918.1 adenosine deaminase [Deltaproteobacteria bacterium]
MSDSQAKMNQFLASAPKAELHIHIEGTIEPDLLLQMAERNGIVLPFDTPEGVLALQNLKKSGNHNNLSNFLDCLDISRGVLRQARDYYDITMRFLKKCKEENIVYSEVMFDPQQGMRQGVAFETIIESLRQAQKDGRAAFGVETQWIMCFQRDHAAYEANDILTSAEKYRDIIVGIGLDNYETVGFPDLFKEVFKKAKSQGFRLTSHCDVNQPDSLAHIQGCINTLNVERIDHGLNSAYDETLTKTILSHGISLTGCPTFFNTDSSSPPDRLEMIKKLLRSGVIISLNTDDPEQFGSGWLTQTLIAAQKAGGFDREDMIQFLKNAFQSAWLPEDRKNHFLKALQTFCSNE